MNTGIFYWINHFNSLTNYAAFFIGIALYRNFPREIKTIFYFVTLGVLTETFARLFIHFVMKNAMPIGHFYFPIAFLLAGWFYIQVLKGFIKPIYIVIVIAIFEVYSVINSVFIQSLFEFASLVSAIGSILIFMFSIAFFIKVMIEAKIMKLASEPLIWINTAFLIYYTFNFFYYSLYNLRIIASPEVTQIAIRFFSLMNLLFYLIICIAFLMFRKKKNH
jgi:hypothetical protein